MSERETKPATNLSWAEGPGENGVSEPSAKRAAGYFEGTAPNRTDADYHPAEEYNWQLREHGRRWAWLESFIAREFETITEALAADDSYGRRFVLYPSNFSLGPGTVIYTTQGADGAVDIGDLVTDGQRIYYYQATNKLRACTIDDPSASSWSKEYTTLAGLATDGRYVYVGDTAIAGVRVLQPSDGEPHGTLASHTGGSPSYPTVMAGNGLYFCCVDAGDQHSLEFYELAQFTTYSPTYLAAHDLDALGGTIYDVAVHGNVAYVVWISSAVEYHVSAILISGSPSQIWDVNLSGLWVTPAAPNSVCTDGEMVFVGSDQADDSSNAQASVHAFARYDGAELWTADLGASNDAERVSCDHRYVIATDHSGNKTWTVCKDNGAVVASVAGEAYATDGVAWVGTPYNTNQNIARLSLHFHAQEYVVANVQDPWRRPFAHRVVPL